MVCVCRISWCQTIALFHALIMDIFGLRQEEPKWIGPCSEESEGNRICPIYLGFGQMSQRALRNMHAIVVKPPTCCTEFQLEWTVEVRKMGQFVNFCVERFLRKGGVEMGGRSHRRRMKQIHLKCFLILWLHRMRTWSQAFLPKGWPGALAFNTALSHAVTQQQLKWKASLHPQTN